VSTKTLAFVAAALFLLGAGAVLAGASRLGHLHSSDSVDLFFENPLLKAKTGQLVLLRPLQTNLPWMRVQTFKLEANPDPHPDKTLHPEPHFVVIKMFRDPRGESWQFVPGDPRGPLPLASLGSLDARAWLEQIEMVTDKGPDGSSRRVACATFADPEGSIYRYFHDPKRPVTAVGWYRMAISRPDGTTELYFAQNAN
jgi:hypothetical protein